jgi:hypothetical protein
MKSVCNLGLAVVMLSLALSAQAPPARTDVYHVLFAQAVSGKAAQLGDSLKTPNQGDPMPDHFLVLRHQDGAEWDYVVITHMGTKATVSTGGPATPPSARDLIATHNDTYVSGPAWPEFVKAMGLGDQAAKSGNSVYVVGVYRPLPGHRDELEKQLSASTPGGTDAGAVLMQHLEGGPWTYMAITRYDSWQKFAENESTSVAQTNKGSGGWFDLRQFITMHNDTLTDRIAP